MAAPFGTVSPLANGSSTTRPGISVAITKCSGDRTVPLSNRVGAQRSDLPCAIVIVSTRWRKTFHERHGLSDLRGLNAGQHRRHRQTRQSPLSARLAISSPQYSTSAVWPDRVADELPPRLFTGWHVAFDLIESLTREELIHLTHQVLTRISIN